MSEVERLREVLAEDIPDQDSRESVFRAACDIADELDRRDLFNGPTGLALGYVQSGKTTAMTALAAECADRGYNVVIALLGVTNLLLSQNTSRLVGKLGIDSRNDYRWVSIPNPNGRTSTSEIEDWLGKGRTILIPVLKNAKRINDLANALSSIGESSRLKCLVIDDEADQASLNTLVRSGDESKVYAAIDRLRTVIVRHGYVQFTATPYAPLLLEADDPLFPQFVCFLEPGSGYTGGREFFMDHAEQVIRYIPAADEQGSKLPIEFPASLRSALWNFVIGSAVLDKTIAASRPISMLIHPSSRKDAQDRYFFLLTREIAELTVQARAATSISDLAPEAAKEYGRLIRGGANELKSSELMDGIRYVLSEVKTWLLHSATAVKQVDWNLSPFHILIGGNKLDRGFTIEGLTVTYMNRPSSDQIDTIEQRARAFGYRAEFLPYCQFFSSARTIKMLREVVVTEYDLRSRLVDAVESGQSIAEWAQEIGLLLPEGSKPTRDNVVVNLSRAYSGWRQLRRPIRSEEAVDHNWQLTSDFGLLDAPLVNYQRLSFRTKEAEIESALQFLNDWQFDPGVSRWEYEEWLKVIDRHSPHQFAMLFVLMEQDAGTPSVRSRVRKALPEEGYINLFQGRDVNPQPDVIQYPGDRLMWPVVDSPSDVLVQVHRVHPRECENERMLTLAIYLGDREMVRKGRRYE